MGTPGRKPEHHTRGFLAVQHQRAAVQLHHLTVIENHPDPVRVELRRVRHWVSTLQQGSGIKVASCTANGVIADPAFKPLLDAAVNDPNAVPDASVVDRFQQSVLTIASECQHK